MTALLSIMPQLVVIIYGVIFDVTAELFSMVTVTGMASGVDLLHVEKSF
jgi:hypothetical protein